jgi:hypothetical protein
MKTFREFTEDEAEPEMDEIAAMDIALRLSLAKELDLLTEGIWRDAHLSGWKYRTDPARPQMNQQAHVHVSLNKHTSAPNKQASWNADGSRHDRKNFHDKTGATHAAQDIARQALMLPPEFILEENALRKLAEEAVTGSSDAQFYFKIERA